MEQGAQDTDSHHPTKNGAKARTYATTGRLALPDSAPLPLVRPFIDDDQEACARAVDSMMPACPNLERRHLAPSDAGVSSIGHFGLFGPAASAAWPEIINWLDRH